MIPKETVDKIIDAARIEDVVSDFLALKRRGASLVACCPFHNEKTPSFYVTPSKGIYKCFGCGKSGTAVKFVMEHEGMTYPEALKYLARKYGIEVIEKEETAEEIMARQKSESLYLVSEFAQKHFAENLKSGEGKVVGYAYFKNRGLEDSIIEKYGLGWASTNRTDLSLAARKAGYKEEYLVETGLSYKNNDGSLSDRFYDRVIFPIHSPSGRVIAFGGRTLKSGHPAMKYVNTPTTEIYAKEKSLYGIWFAKGEIARRNKCYLVEGYLDVLSMHQLGITNTVASSGTALTIEQIRLIKRFSENITIMYDGDSAGIHAAMRGIGLILQEGLNVKIVLIPDGDDPDSFAKKHSLEEFEKFIEENEQDFISFKTELLLESSNNDPLKKAELINDIADTIAVIPDPVKRTVYAQSSSDKFEIDSNIIFNRVKTTRRKFINNLNKQQEREAKRNIEETSKEDVKPIVFENKILAPIERDFLWFILKYGLNTLTYPQDSEFAANNGVTVADFIRANLENEGKTLENSLYKQMYDAYFKLYDADDSLGQDDIVKHILNGPDQELATEVLNLIEDDHELTLQNIKNSITQIDTILAVYVPRAIMVYQIKRIQNKSKELTQSLSQETDSSVINKTLQEIQQLAALRKVFEEKLGRVL